MKRVKAVIGANFGDEGKGLMTDYFCDTLASYGPVLNVRANGGAQAGHTVETSDGRRHVFKHIGAGSFVPGTSTYLSPFFIVNPILFHEELAVLRNLGLTPAILADKGCMVTIPQDMMINQIAERSRCGGNHGSCGVGIFETVCRSKEETFQISLQDCLNRSAMRQTIFRVISEYVPARLATLGVTPSPADLELLHDPEIIETYLDDAEQFLDLVAVVDTSILNQYESLVFEGAQGLLLDQRHMAYFPHLTPSNTGLANVAALLKTLAKPYELEACYVTRSYFTRHGAGPFATACGKEEINANMTDRTNVTNEFQGAFRYGFFDLALLQRTVTRDLTAHGNSLQNLSASVSVTHLNETGGALACADGAIPVDLLNIPGTTKLYGSDGKLKESVKVRRA